MWIIVALNGIGLLMGMLKYYTLMYVILGISFCVFFHKYAAIIWKLVYERFVNLSSIVESVNTKLANEFVCVFVLGCIYVVMVKKIGMGSIFAPIFQSIIFWFINQMKDDKEGNIVILLCYIVELVLAFWIAGR